MKEPIFFINERFYPQSKANIPVMDLGLLRGYGVFDFLRTYNGIPFYLNKHIKRLFNSAKLINLEIPWSREKIKEWVYKTLKANNYSESQIRVVVTGGETQDSINPRGNPTVIILVSRVVPYPETLYERGVKVITHPVTRLLPEAKSINYIPAIMALKKAKKENALEAIYIDKEGNLLEGTTSNLFFFKKEKLITPKEKILYGITREVVISLAKTKFPLEERKVNIKEIPGFSECFLTASNKEVMPVVQIDNQKIGDGRVGQNTRIVMNLFIEFTQNYNRNSKS